MITPNLTSREIRPALIAFIITVASILSACDNTGKSAQVGVEKHLISSKSYQRQHQYHAAIIEAQNVISLDESNIEGRVQLASIYNELGQSAHAIRHLKQVQANENENYTFALAEAYLIANKPGSAWLALERHKQLAALRPIDYLQYAAKTKVRLGQTDEATALFQKILNEDEKNIDALLGLARVAARKDRLDDTRSYVEKILIISPNQPDALLMQALMVLNQGDIEGAESLLSTLLSTLPQSDIMTPRRAMVLQTLANVLTKQGRNNEALVYTKMLASQFPGMLQVKSIVLEAIASYEAGNLNEAETLLESALEVSPGHQTVGTLLGMINFLQGDIESSHAYFTQFINEESASEDVKHAYALTQLQLNQPQKVISLLQKRVQAGSEDPATLALYGMAAISGESPRGGLAALKKAMKLDPERQRLALVIANYYNKAAQPDLTKALHTLESAYAVKPDDIYIQSGLLQQYALMGLASKSHALIEANLSSNVNEMEGLLMAGNFYLNNAEYAKASSYFKQVVLKDQDNFKAHLGIAEAAFKNEEWKQATESFTKVLELNSTLKHVYIGLLRAFKNQGQTKRGVEIAQTYSHTSPEAIAGLAEFHVSNGDTDLAIQFLNTAIAKDDNNKLYLQHIKANALHYSGNRQVNNDNVAAARGSYQEAIGLTPSNIELSSALIRLEIKDKQYPEAEKLIHQLSFQQGASIRVRLLEAELAVSQNDMSSAARLFQLVWDANPSNYVGESLFLSLQGNRETQQSFAFLDKWKARFPNSEAALSLFGNRMLATKNYAEAIRAFEKTLTLRPRSVTALNNLAWLYGETNDSRALDMARKAHSLTPESANVLDTYGWLLVKNGKEAEGKVLLEQALQIAPENETIIDHLRSIKAMQLMPTL